MKIVLTLDDFSVLNNRLDLLWRLKKHFDNFKVSLFTVPDDIKHKIGNRDEALAKIKDCLDWIQIIPHGLRHNSSEAKKWDYWLFRDKIVPAIKKHFDKDGLPYVFGFKAPHWDWTQGVVNALNELNWFGAISPKRPDMPVTKRFYIHDYSIHEDFILKDGLKLQGHLNGTSPDDLEKNIDKLLKLPQVEWCFATEFIEEL
jgi:hypothetical protein